ncbi:hypothetical protein IWX90DRAFT_412784 [Phyllosticta citrichinensis]|uniref:Uncharacterized protein n=1 Tax=Phyllosticta citrichinensis TaxID=1130410 RepID=A0ABR1XYV7_9PEZI
MSKRGRLLGISPRQLLVCVCVCGSPSTLRTHRPLLLLSDLFPLPCCSSPQLFFLLSLGHVRLASPIAARLPQFSSLRSWFFDFRPPPPPPPPPPPHPHTP